MKPITRYIKNDAPVDYYTLGASAARYKEIAIGYKKFNENGSFSIVINPKGSEKLTFSDKDDLIVITDGPANDNSESRNSGDRKTTQESA